MGKSLTMEAPNYKAPSSYGGKLGRNESRNSPRSFQSRATRTITFRGMDGQMRQAECAAKFFSPISLEQRYSGANTSKTRTLNKEPEPVANESKFNSSVEKMRRECVIRDLITAKLQGVHTTYDSQKSAAE